MKYKLATIISLLGIILSFTSHAQENTNQENTKAAFVTAWETHQRSLPTTVKLEKTDKPNIYNYETTLFSYKGELILHNVVISKDINYYYDYDIDLNNVIKGFAEVELSGLSNDDFYRKYPRSRELWGKDNVLLYNEDQGVWLSPKEWKDTPSDIIENNNSCVQRTTQAQYMKIIIIFLPAIILAIIWILVIMFSGRKQKKYFEKYDISMERQLEAIELQKQAFDVQKKAVKLLEQIANNKDHT